MKIWDSFRQKTYQRSLRDKERNQAVRALIADLLTKGSEIDCMLVMMYSKGEIHVFEAGLIDDFEALAFIDRGKYLINRDGIVKP